MIPQEGDSDGNNLEYLWTWLWKPETSGKKFYVKDFLFCLIILYELFYRRIMVENLWIEGKAHFSL